MVAIRPRVMSPEPAMLNVRSVVEMGVVAMKSPLPISSTLWSWGEEMSMTTSSMSSAELKVTPAIFLSEDLTVSLSCLPLTSTLMLSTSLRVPVMVHLCLEDWV